MAREAGYLAGESVAELDDERNGHPVVPDEAGETLEPPVPELDVKPFGPADFDRDTLLHVYRTMLLSRRLDEKMLTLLKQGKGSFHVGAAGHEATQVAFGLLSRPGHDWFAFYYRDLTMHLSIGGTPRDVLLHHFSKADDPHSGGRQMSEHFSSRERNLLPLSSSVGTQFLPALGVGLALKREKSDAYVYCSCGEGATSQGAFHESMNLASIWNLPVIFVLENNMYSMGTSIERGTTMAHDLPKKAAAYGIDYLEFDGMDVREIYDRFKPFADDLRERQRPGVG